MTGHARAYRALLVLYPGSFRREYAADLVQTFLDLARDRGVASAWCRCSVDLAVTVPRYRMEALVHRPVSSSALTAVALAVGMAGVVGLLLGGVAAMPLLVIAAVLAASQRTALAKSMVIAPDRRRARLRTTAVLALVCVAAAASWAYHVNRYDELGDATALLHNLVGVLAFFGAVAFGVATMFSSTDVHPAADGT